MVLNLNTYAQVNALNICVGHLETSGEVDAPHMLKINQGENRLGQRWNGTAWEAVAPTVQQDAAAQLALIDQQTGMGRTTRETLIAIGKKVAADVSYLETKEAQAVALRAKLK